MPPCRNVQAQLRALTIVAEVRELTYGHYAALRKRHAPLFAREPELRCRYPLPLRTRLAYRLQLRSGLLLPPGVVPRLLALKLRLRQITGGGETDRAGTNERARARDAR